MFKKIFGDKGKSAPESKQQSNPKEDAEVARQAFAQRDFAHAFFHISWALASEPMNAEWRGLLEQINANIDDPKMFVPHDQQMDYARGAALAYLFAKRQNYNEALSLISNVLKAIPDARYLPWIANWLSAPDHVGKIAPATMNRLLAVLLGKFPGDYVADEAARQQLERLIPAVEPAQSASDGKFMMLYSSLLRKVGRQAEALTVARKAYELEPSQYTATMNALAERALGHIDESLAMYKKSLEYDPSANDVRLDIGDMLTGAGRVEEGLTYYKQILSTDKNNAWATLHYLYFQSQLDRKGDWDKQLKAFIETHRGDPDTQRALQSLRRQSTPYVGYLPEPSLTACVNLPHKWATPRKVQNHAPMAKKIRCV